MAQKINPMLLVALFSLIVALVAGQYWIGGALLGLPGNVDIFVKDSAGQPIGGAVCYINPAGLSTCSDPSILNSNGNMVCQIRTTSSAAGRCAFTGIPSGEIQPWGVACTSTSGITKQGSVEVRPPAFGSTQTSNVYVTLSGCSSVISTTTTTTLQSCTSHTQVKCYNGDVYYYNSCGDRQERITACGTFGCSNGACLNAPSTTQPPVTVTTTTQPGATTTTQPPSCVDSCMGTGCSTDAAGNGFRCVVSSSGCRGWAQDTTCNAGSDNTMWIAIAAAVVTLGAMLVYITRRKR